MFERKGLFMIPAEGMEEEQLFEQASESCLQRSRNSETTQLKRQITELEAKLTKKDEVLGEVMEEYVALKKSRGAS